MSALRAAALAVSILAITMSPACKRGAGEAAPSAEPAEAPEARPDSAAIPETTALSEPGNAGEDIELGEGEGHGGPAHIHGLATLVATVDGPSLTVLFDSPLANFGLGESGDASSLKVEDLANRLFTIERGSSCTRKPAKIETERSGAHASAILTTEWNCTAIGDVTGVSFSGFDIYPDFERITAVYATPDGQSSVELNIDEPTLIFD